MNQPTDKHGESKAVQAERIVLTSDHDGARVDFIIAPDWTPAIRINVGGNVVVKTARAWHEAAWSTPSADLAPHHPTAAIRRFYFDWHDSSPPSNRSAEVAFIAGYRKANEIEYAARSSARSQEDEYLVRRMLDSLDKAHYAVITGTGKDPEKYSSTYSEAAHLIRRLERLPPPQYPFPAPVAPNSATSAQLPADNDGKEQDAFEKWAASEAYTMTTHPLHFLFLDKRTYAARDGWRAALRYVAQMARSDRGAA